MGMGRKLGWLFCGVSLQSGPLGQPAGRINKSIKIFSMKD